MKLRLKGFWRWALFIGIGLVLIVVLFGVEENIRGRVMLRHWNEQMRAKNEPLTLAEVLPATPRPEDNAAPYIAPFLVGRVIPQSVPIAMRYVAPGKCAVVPWQREWYSAGLGKVQFTTNGFRPQSRTARRNFIPPTNGAPYSVCTVADLETDLAAASNTMASLKFGLRKSGFDFGINYSGGFNTPMTHLVPMRTTVQWLRAASLHALMETNLAGSLEYLQDMLALVRLETNGVFLIEQLVRISMLQLTAGATWEALQVDGWTDEQLAALQAAWRDTESTPWIGRAGQVERIMGNEEIDRIAELGPDRLSGFMFTPPAAKPPVNTITDFFESLSHVPDAVGPALFRGVYFPFWRLAWKDHDKLNLNESWQPLVEASRRQREAPNWKVHKSLVPERESSDDMPRSARDVRHLVSRLLGGATQSAIRRAVDADTTRTLVETAIALHRWKLAHGTFPQKLEELVPGILRRLPLDPYDGQPLRYRISTNAPFTLYSVGHNGQDDGGDAQPETGSASRSPNFLTGLDIVWPSPATREEIESFEHKQP